MTVLTCAAVRRRLQAFHDRELTVGETISVESHLHDCPPCAKELRDLQSVGDALRMVAAPAPADDWTGVQSSVVSRMRAEAHEAWTARAMRMFDDLHLVWVGLASTAGTFVCAATVLGMMHFASPERNDSLAAMIAAASAPLGSDLNPGPLNSRIRVPSFPTYTDKGVMAAMLYERSVSEQDFDVTLSAIVNTEGRVSGVEVLPSSVDRQEVLDILRALSHERLEPAQFGGAPVAVNLVWLVTHTTVKAKFRS